MEELPFDGLKPPAEFVNDPTKDPDPEKLENEPDPVVAENENEDVPVPAAQRIRVPNTTITAISKL